MDRLSPRAETKLETFKRRLRWLIQTTEDGTLRNVAARLKKMGYPVHEVTVGRWIDEKSPSQPDPIYLAALLEIHHNVSADYLLGRKQPETVEEKFIESRL